LGNRLRRNLREPDERAVEMEIAGVDEPEHDSPLSQTGQLRPSTPIVALPQRKKGTKAPKAGLRRCDRGTKLGPTA
jgi:hypothetical protein